MEKEKRKELSAALEEFQIISFIKSLDMDSMQDKIEKRDVNVAIYTGNDYLIPGFLDLRFTPRVGDEFIVPEYALLGAFQRVLILEVAHERGISRVDFIKKIEQASKCFFDNDEYIKHLTGLITNTTPVSEILEMASDLAHDYINILTFTVKKVVWDIYKENPEMKVYVGF